MPRVAGASLGRKAGRPIWIRSWKPRVETQALLRHCEKYNRIGLLGHRHFWLLYVCVSVELPPEPFLEPYAPPAVALVPDPKDFDTVLPPSDTPTQASKLPLTLDEEEGLTSVQEREPLEADEHPNQPDELQPSAGPEALPW